MKKVFSRFNILYLLGTRIEPENLFVLPLKANETLRKDGQGNFYRLQVPDQRASIWNRTLFWIHSIFNQNRHIEVIYEIIDRFGQQCEGMDCLTLSEYQAIISQIECLKCLKNDFGYAECDQEQLKHIEEELSQIENRIKTVFDHSLEQLMAEQDKSKREEFLILLKEAQIGLTLLEQESLFGRLEARRLPVAYSDDVPHLFEERLQSLQIRILLAQEIFEDIESVKSHSEQLIIPHLCEYLNIIGEGLDQQVNNLEIELEALIDNLRLFSLYHPDDRIIRGEFDLNDSPESFAQKKTDEKLILIQDHLNRLAA